MSMENLKKFMQLVESDANVAKKAAEIGYRNYAGLIAYGQELNLEFAAKDFEELKKEALGEHRELEDEELKDATGGSFSGRGYTPWLI